MFRLYARKNSSYFVNRVMRFDITSLRSDLMERARDMARMRSGSHPWCSMGNEEMLRSAGLILTDEQTQQEGITLAAILLFGKDNTIMSVLPQHKTDAIFRVFNVDRYDDRDVIITNLLESYDRLIAFGERHLNNLFTMDGMISVSARDKILREIISNLLVHRDFSSGYVAKFIIEKSRIYTENANLSHGHGTLELASFEPFQKNPPISKIFREIGLADELGSGMRNTYKYTRLYSGSEPEFVEGDIFRTIIPLKEAATATVGPVSSETGKEESTEAGAEAGAEVSAEAGGKIKLDAERLQSLLEFCSVPRTRAEMQKHCNIKSEKYFREKILQPMLAAGFVDRTIADKPRSPKQKYMRR